MLISPNFVFFVFRMQSRITNLNLYDGHSVDLGEDGHIGVSSADVVEQEDLYPDEQVLVERIQDRVVEQHAGRFHSEEDDVLLGKPLNLVC